MILNVAVIEGTQRLIEACPDVNIFLLSLRDIWFFLNPPAANFPLMSSAFLREMLCPPVSMSLAAPPLTDQQNLPIRFSKEPDITEIVLL